MPQVGLREAKRGGKTKGDLDTMETRTNTARCGTRKGLIVASV